MITILLASVLLLEDVKMYSRPCLLASPVIYPGFMQTLYNFSLFFDGFVNTIKAKIKIYQKSFRLSRDIVNSINLK